MLHNISRAEELICRNIHITTDETSFTVPVGTHSVMGIIEDNVLQISLLLQYHECCDMNMERRGKQSPLIFRTNTIREVRVFCLGQIF
jgi:hypothetical protein